ncbi:MAG: hypothetical protein JWM47_1984 [Acidimicrobiales bacterium]|nr:hypothetical protein [Acidimicrobiales bacterium]
MATVDLDRAVPMSRRTILAAAELVAAGDPDRAEEAVGSLLGAALAIAEAHGHLVVTSVSAGDVRRIDVWLGAVGVAALPRQADDDEPGPVVALPPFTAQQVCLSAARLDPAVVAAGAPLNVGGGLVGLTEQVVAASAGTALNVFDWSSAAGDVRWVVLDSPDGRVATFEAPADARAPLRLQPTSPMAVAVALAEQVSVAVRAATG